MPGSILNFHLESHFYFVSLGTLAPRRQGDIAILRGIGLTNYFKRTIEKLGGTVRSNLERGSVVVAIRLTLFVTYILLPHYLHYLVRRNEIYHAYQ